MLSGIEYSRKGRSENMEIPFLEQSSGLQSLGILQGLGNPEVGISNRDIIGMITGGLAGWWISTKFPNMVVKYVGVVVGAELGILIARMFSSRNTIVGGKNVQGMQIL